LSFPKDRPGLERYLAEHKQVVIELRGANDARSVRLRGAALWTVAEALLRLDRLDEASEIFALALPILWRDETSWGHAVNATGRRAFALVRLARHAEAVALLNELVDRVGLDWVEPSLPDVLPEAPRRARHMAALAQHPCQRRR
jgi:hypothetical protein